MLQLGGFDHHSDLTDSLTTKFTDSEASAVRTDTWTVHMPHRGAALVLRRVALVLSGLALVCHSQRRARDVCGGDEGPRHVGPGGHASPAWHATA